jgi:transcriptional regulator with XRE-family HTH domain
MESTVKQRLVQFIKMMHLTQKAFEERCGMGNGYVNSIRKGIGPEKMQDIIRAFPELNREWLLFGEGNPLKTIPTISGDITVTGNHNSHIGHGQHNMPAVIEIKESGVEVECPNCGEVIEVPGSTVLAMVPKEITRKPDIDLEKWRRKHPQQMTKIDFSEIWGDEPFVVQVDTRAMEPDYREGTFLVLQPLPDISYATADGIAYVIDTMKPHTLFRNLTDKYDGTYLLTSNSDKRSSIRLKAEDIITVYDIVGTFRMGR